MIQVNQSVDYHVEGFNVLYHITCININKVHENKINICPTEAFLDITVNKFYQI